MSVTLWNCCRACLKTENLNPIFPNQLFIDKYCNVIETCAGIQVHPTDSLPQQMCAQCIIFINEINKFRRKCEESHKYLLNRVTDGDCKIETKQIKSENTNQEIDISYLVSDEHNLRNVYQKDILRPQDRLGAGQEDDDSFTDHEDHIPLGTLYSNIESLETDKLTANSCHNKTVKKCSKRKAREKKENKRDKKEKDRVKEEIECEYCHKVLTSRLSLRNHYKIHTGFDFVCEHCGKKFITRRLLLMHCRAKHGYEKTDKCSYCDYRGSNAEQVKIHERLHTGERPYVCSHCSAGFHRRSSYLTHIATHLPDKTVQCDQCPARFKSVTLMRIHKNRHKTPAYSFRCRVCDNSFARRRNVVRHLQRIHGLPPGHEHMERIKLV